MLQQVSLNPFRTTFLQVVGACFLINSFQTFVAPSVGTAFESNPFTLIATPLALASLFALLAFVFAKNKLKSVSQKSFLALLLLFSFPAALILMNTVLTHSHEEYANEILKLGFPISDFAFLQPYKIAASLLIAVPYILFNLYVFAQFYTYHGKQLLFIFLAEFIGAAFGALVSTVSLDIFGWEASLTLVLLIAAILMISIKSPKIKYITLFLFTVAFYIFSGISKFQPNLHLAARDYSQSATIKETRQSWNTFSLVQTLNVQLRDLPSIQHVAIGAGSGHSYFPSDSTYPFTTTDLANIFRPQSALVLFAGAGHELKQIAQFDPTPKKIVGVELNQNVIKHSLLDSRGELEKLLSDSTVQLINSDVRLFLETSTQKFDLVLYSWSGATTAYYSGAIMHTTQHAFTTEALAKAHAQLSDNGYLIIFGGSKLNIIASLKTLGIKDLQLKTILLIDKKDKNWQKVWDNHILIVAKNNLLENQDLPRLKTELNGFTESIQYQVAIAPWLPFTNDYEYISELLTTQDIATTVKDQSAANRLQFKIYTDDLPFVYGPIHTDNYLSVNYWKTNLSDFINNRSSGNNFLTIFFLLIFIIYFTFFAIKYVQEKASFYFFYQAPLFYILGITSSIFQFLCTYKFVLYIGNPTWALTASLLSFQLSFGIATGLFLRYEITRRNLITLFLFSVSIWGLLIAHFIHPILNPLLFSIPVFAKVIVFLFAVIIANISHGLIFTYLLNVTHKNANSRLWLIGFESLGFAIGLAFGSNLAENYGFSACFIFITCLLILQIGSVIFFQTKKIYFN